MAHFRDLELEQLDEELGRRSCQKQLRAARLGAYFLQEGLDTVLRLHLLTRNHVGTRHETLGIAAEVHINAVAVNTFHNAADKR